MFGLSKEASVEVHMAEAEIPDRILGSSVVDA